MSEQRGERDLEERLRRAAVTVAHRQPPEPEPPQPPEERAAEQDEDDQAPAMRIEQKTQWVELQIRRAIERGEFDNLPGAGRPIPGLGGTHDPDWWLKGLIERERLTGLLPPALAVRREHAELEAELDRETTEQGVRRRVEEFNHRVVEARRQLLGGPPVVTPTRDVDQEVAAWQMRRDERRRRQREQQQEQLAAEHQRRRARSRRRRAWWGRRRS